MRLFKTTSDFYYKGKQCVGIPFLCNDEMEFLTAPNDFLLWISLENSNTSSQATWQNYAESLYDYFSWLEANGLAWNAVPKKGLYGEEISNIAMYRNWSADLIDPETGAAQIQLSTIRRRLSQIMQFYKWCLDRNRIADLPWRESSKIVQVRELHPSMYRHTKAVRLVAKDDLRPKVKKKLIPLLQVNQCRELLKLCGTHTLQLMTKLMLQSGLRNEECRTFPRKYVFDPIGRNKNQRIAINISPNDMAIKGNKPRRIYVTWHLMKDLFDYLNFGEGAQRAKLFHKLSSNKSPYVFLNQAGQQWSEKGLNNSYRRLWAPDSDKSPALPFRVTPHMLRHTFATLELYAESRRKNMGEALAWVRDRLGHSSISTTTQYIHCLDLVGEVDLNIYQREMDVLLDEAMHA